MKKIALLIALAAIVPAAMFAQTQVVVATPAASPNAVQFGIGGAGFYKSPILVGQNIDLSNANTDQFSFGVDARLKVSVFQAQALVLYSAGNSNSVNTYLDVGIAADLSILRLSLGAGPNFIVNFGHQDPVQAGLNAKLGADLMLGPVSLGLSYIMALNVGNNTTVNTGSGLLGAQIIFWM